MRRLVALVVVAAVALTLAGCGGAEEKAETPAASTPAATPPPPPVADAEALDDRTPLVEVKFEPFPTGKSRETTSLPEAITQRLETDQPMLLFFFDVSQKTADDQRAEIDALLAEYRGTIDLLAYDVGQNIGDGAHDDADAQAISLARALKVDFTPYIVLVDEQGLITWRHRGFVDRGVIERELLRATD